MTELPEITIEIEGWAPIRKGSLRGYVTFSVPPGIRFPGWAAFERSGRRWIIPPGRPRIDPDGLVMRSRQTGAPLYSPTVLFVNDGARLRFELALIDALLKVFPHALDAPGGEGS